MDRLYITAAFSIRKTAKELDEEAGFSPLLQTLFLKVVGKTQ
jgi:hypothetical protein